MTYIIIPNNYAAAEHDLIVPAYNSLREKVTEETLTRVQSLINYSQTIEELLRDLSDQHIDVRDVGAINTFIISLCDEDDEDVGSVLFLNVIHYDLALRDVISKAYYELTNTGCTQSTLNQIKFIINRVDSVDSILIELGVDQFDEDDVHVDVFKLRMRQIIGDAKADDVEAGRSILDVNTDIERCNNDIMKEGGDIITAINERQKFYGELKAVRFESGRVRTVEAVNAEIKLQDERMRSYVENLTLHDTIRHDFLSELRMMINASHDLYMEQSHAIDYARELADHAARDRDSKINDGLAAEYGIGVFVKSVNAVSFNDDAVSYLVAIMNGAIRASVPYLQFWQLQFGINGAKLDDAELRFEVRKQARLRGFVYMNDIA